MPSTVNKTLNVPNTGDLPGTWGSAAVNPNMSSIDGMLGGSLNIALSAATTFALGLPPGAATSIAPGAGPYQSQNALIKFSGTLAGNIVVQFTMPGYYIIQNACAVGTSYVQLAPSAGTGNAIGAPPGQKVHVYFDGTDMDYVNTLPVGAALDLTGATTYPAWMNACTVRPYLIKDGSTYSTVTYPQLAAQLGSTFGGNGVSTFGVPDERARARIALDTLSVATGTYAGRLTAAISGVNGTTMGAAGGSESLMSHNHFASVSDPGHVHPVSGGVIGLTAAAGISTGGSNGAVNASNITINLAVTGVTVGIASTGGGASQNVQPSIVSFLPLLKT